MLWLVFGILNYIWYRGKYCEILDIEVVYE